MLDLLLSGNSKAKKAQVNNALPEKSGLYEKNEGDTPCFISMTNEALEALIDRRNLKKDMNGNYVNTVNHGERGGTFLYNLNRVRKDRKDDIKEFANSTEVEFILNGDGSTRLFRYICGLLAGDNYVSGLRVCIPLRIAAETFDEKDLSNFRKFAETHFEQLRMLEIVNLIDKQRIYNEKDKRYVWRDVKIPPTHFFANKQCIVGDNLVFEFTQTAFEYIIQSVRGECPVDALRIDYRQRTRREVQAWLVSYADMNRNNKNGQANKIGIKSVLEHSRLDIEAGRKRGYSDKLRKPIEAALDYACKSWYYIMRDGEPNVLAAKDTKFANFNDWAGTNIHFEL